MQFFNTVLQRNFQLNIDALVSKQISLNLITLALFICTLFVSGCSGSSDSSSQPASSPIAMETLDANETSAALIVDDDTSAGAGEIVESTTDKATTDAIISAPENNETEGSESEGNETEDSEPEESDEIDATNESLNNTAEETATTEPAMTNETEDANESETAAPNTAVSSPVVPEHESLVSTRVDFDITVPVYQSNALQVRVAWGDLDLSASWAGDEFWTLSEDFPINTEHPLTVSFYDNNGDITLGTVERNFATDANSAQMVSIEATDFETQRWDDDSDGVSNLDELSLGTDPLDENSPDDSTVDLQDTLQISYLGWSAPAAAYYEPEINSLDFPVSSNEIDFIDNLPITSETTVTDIALSSDGNGTYSQTYNFFIALDMPFNRSSIATRTSEDGTVSWNGTENFSGSSRFYGAIDHSFETTNMIDGRTLIQQGNGTLRLRRGAWTDLANIVIYNYNFVLDLDSIDEDSTCSILHGNSYHSFEDNIDFDSFTESTVSRTAVEENWSWMDTVDGEVTSGEAIEVISRLYCDFRFDQTDWE